MSEEQTKPPEIILEEYKLEFDGPEHNMMFIKIPIRKVSEFEGNRDIIDGEIYLRGFFELAKEQALLAVGTKRLRRKQAVLKVGGIPQQPLLRVH